MSDPRLWPIEQSFRDLLRIYQPGDTEKFIQEFMKKYKIPRGYELRLREIAEKEKDHR